MRIHYRYIIPMLLAVLTAFSSCSDFFSNSWAKWAARDPNKLIPRVSLDNIDDLLKMAENDPDLSLAILKKLKNAADGASSDEDKAKLQSAALEAAINAVGLGQAVISTAGKLTGLNGDDPETEAKDLIVDAINGLTNLEETSAALISVLPPVGSPEFDNFASTASANDLAMAATVLVAGEAKKQADNFDGDFNEYLDDLESRIRSGDPEDLEESENLAQAMALAAALVGRQDELDSSLLNALSGLGLLS